eukprot:3429359-Rhodomonas_salina.1
MTVSEGTEATGLDRLRGNWGLIRRNDANFSTFCVLVQQHCLSLKYGCQSSRTPMAGVELGPPSFPASPWLGVEHFSLGPGFKSCRCTERGAYRPIAQKAI